MIRNQFGRLLRLVTLHLFPFKYMQSYYHPAEMGVKLLSIL